MGENKKDEYDWIEPVVNAGRLIGLNPVRTRWKLRAWQDKMSAKKGAVSDKAAAVTREHKICPKCRAMNSVEDKVCVKCGAKLRSRPVEMADRFLGHFAVGLTSETMIATGFVAAYAVVALNGKTSGWLGFSSPDLIWMGGLQVPMTLDGQWWRLLTCVFLHGGLWHIGFNTYALIYLMPVVREVYGANKALFVFLVTGIGASLASMFWTLYQFGSDPLFLQYRVSIGASGALCGWIGLLLVWGHRDGTGSGIAIRNSMARWALYILVFGFFIGADNAAHVGGWIAGGLLGLAVPASLTVREGRAWEILGAGAAILMLAAVIGIAYLGHFTEPPHLPSLPGMPR
jgi:rhomboid protease GluP